MPGNPFSPASSSSATREGSAATVSAALRYARILKGLSARISSRSAISLSRRAIATFSTVAEIIIAAPPSRLRHVTTTSSPPDRPAPDGWIQRAHGACRDRRDRSRVLTGRDRLLRAQRGGARAGGGGLAADLRARGRGRTSVDRRRSGGWSSGAVQEGLHAVATHGDAWAQRRRKAGETLRRRDGGRAQGGWRHPRFRAGSGRLHQPQEHGDRRSRARG